MVEVDLVRAMAEVLAEHGHRVQVEPGWLLDADTGFQITPRLASLEPLEKGGVHTVTTVHVNHPTLVPGGVFEYQHATGDTSNQSIAHGFQD